MALIKCIECGKEVSDKASACIHCGCPIEKEKRTVIIERKKGFIGCAIVPTVYIDDMLVGELETGSSYEVEVPIGEHQLILDINQPGGGFAFSSGNSNIIPVMTMPTNHKRVEKLVITDDDCITRVMFEKGSLEMTITYE